MSESKSMQGMRRVAAAGFVLSFLLAIVALAGSMVTPQQALADDAVTLKVAQGASLTFQDAVAEPADNPFASYDSLPVFHLIRYKGKVYFAYGTHSFAKNRWCATYGAKLDTSTMLYGEWVIGKANVTFFGATPSSSDPIPSGADVYYFGDAFAAVTGWQTIAGNTYYFDEQGVMQTGLKAIGKKKYCFDSYGVMQTGFKKIDGKTYYFNKTGAMQTGFQKIQKKTYYFNKSGVMQTGFKKINKKRYYFSKKGVMATGAKKIDKAYYYFNKKGVMQTGFVKIKGSRYYYDKKTGHKAGYGIVKGYIISLAQNGKCFKIPDYKTGNQDKDARRVAKLIAKCANAKKYSKLMRVSVAARYVSIMSSRCRYTMSGNNYYRAYGVFIAKEYSCAGSTRALGMVLDYMGYSWKHANENAYSHQWCIVKIGKRTGYADGQVGIAGYGKHPAA